MESLLQRSAHEPWNKGKLVGQKASFRIQDIWAIRVRLQMHARCRELALFNLGLDSKLRGCDLVSLRVRDICHGSTVAGRATIMQHKTHRPVQFEITQAAKEATENWISQAKLGHDDFLFPSRHHASFHIGTRQYARIVHSWAHEVGLDSTALVRTRCGEPRPHWSIARPRISGQRNCF